MRKCCSVARCWHVSAINIPAIRYEKQNTTENLEHNLVSTNVIKFHNLVLLLRVLTVAFSNDPAGKSVMTLKCRYRWVIRVAFANGNGDRVIDVMALLNKSLKNIHNSSGMSISKFIYYTSHLRGTSNGDRSKQTNISTTVRNSDIHHVSINTTRSQHRILTIGEHSMGYRGELLGRYQRNSYHQHRLLHIVQSKALWYIVCPI